jgi:N-sulfoglucosamine sulfohydrolase
MRCVQSPRYGYIFNPWSDGEREFRNESQSGRTMNAMVAASAQDERLAQRVELFLHRVPEEFYDFGNDPNALCNLIDAPEYAGEVQSLRDELERWMERTGDPALAAFRDRGSRESLELLMRQTAEEIGGKS